MRKIPTLFRRSDVPGEHTVQPLVTEGCEWVLAGEGVPTRKYDGTCVMFDGVWWWARREVKPGKKPPPDFEPVETDPNTEKTVGWEPATQSPFAKYLAEAIQQDGPVFLPGTYELLGPKINGNPEKVDRHVLIAHREADELSLPKLSRNVYQAYYQLGEFLGTHDIEGIVWHHADGRMAKLKRRDYWREQT